MRNGPTNREIMYFMCTYFAFLLVISVHGDFEDIFWQEGVGIKARKAERVAIELQHENT